MGGGPAAISRDWVEVFQRTKSGHHLCWLDDVTLGLGLFEMGMEGGCVNPNPVRRVWRGCWGQKAPLVEAMFVDHMVRNGTLDIGSV